MFTPSVQREQKTTLHTDFISTDKFGGGMWLSLEDFRNSGERPRRGVEGVSCGRDAMTQLWVVAVPKCLQDCVALLGSHFS